MSNCASCFTDKLKGINVWNKYQILGLYWYMFLALIRPLDICHIYNTKHGNDNSYLGKL